MIIYLFNEARLGLLRNVPAVAAAVLIIFISISVLGVSLLVKNSLNHTIDYLNNQVKIRVMIDPKWNASEIALTIEKNPLVYSVKVESKEEMVVSMSKLFEDKSELLEMFNFSSLPDAITIDMKDNTSVDYMADMLNNTEGITDVIYPGEYVATVIRWTDSVERYSFLAIITLVFASVLTVMMTINLTMIKRRKEVRVKLLLGAKPSHVRIQFLIEGAIIGLMGSILANYLVYFAHENLIQMLYAQLPYVFEEQKLNLFLVFTFSLFGGLLLGLTGSFISTYRTLRYE
ncbi:cell division protein FtsX [Cytobacillus purgationiresistens]|uniref:Cell division protein FtsX n=1 Tax=Cytobacillus purgationiresistens TaxID=863449 RepID=A0ABU0AS71_9BACI|nr:permease-like cell division protein FtsX [Cytobacillus purgationiresistens]MDQ0273724.1 cell division transport system permease protein [Cytobacillus purgationiresistens]